jgi:PKHD-type hydroxylase
MKIFYEFAPFDTPCPPYAYWDDGFSREELDILQNKAREADLIARVGHNVGAVSEDLRRSKITWLNFETDTEWVYERLSGLICKLNRDYYGFDLKGFGELFQLTNYSSDYTGTYDWHIDRGNRNVRKMSAVLQLSEPGEFVGGELQLLHTSDVPFNVEKKRGRLVIFPSHTIHRVTPVTKGSRQSLVSWICGEPLR